MGETLRRRFGPLPVWAWALIFIALLAMYLSYRKKKAAAAAAASQGSQNNLSSNLGTVPVSNLTTAAQPMPIQLGDTFVSTSVPVSTSTTTTVNNPNPPSGTMQPAPVPQPVPAPTAPARWCMGQTCFDGPPKPGYGYTYSNGQWGQTLGSGIGYQPLPGQGAGIGQLLANNPGLATANTPGGANIPGITGYTVSYNGVPL